MQDQSDASELFPGMKYIIYNDCNFFMIIFLDDFHADLRKLLSDVLVKNMSVSHYRFTYLKTIYIFCRSEWRTEASKSQGEWCGRG